MAERTSVGIRLALDQRSAQAVHAALMEALHAKLLEGERREAAREVLERLDRRVPGWLDTAPVGGEAGYLIAAETVLRVLVAAEDGTYARSSLAESELLRELGDAKPLGATATDVLERMLREKLIARRRGPREDERWWAAAPAGRQFLHRNTAAGDARLGGPRRARVARPDLRRRPRPRHRLSALGPSDRPPGRRRPRAAARRPQRGRAAATARRRTA